MLGGDDEQVAATVAVIAAADADIVMLQGVDYDADGVALGVLQDQLGQAGAPYPHSFALRPNTGRPTGVDLDGNGRLGEARDAVGYGTFNGQGGMAILSRVPIGLVRDHSGFLWRDLPEGSAAEVTPAEALDLLPLATVAAWDMQIILPSGVFHLLTLHATPPVFDGPEDRNGLRNADELRFWQLLLDGWSPDGAPFAADRFALIGTLNLDPNRGEGRRSALMGLLTHAALQDPAPQRPGGGMQTADWPEPTPGDMRVDYILPAAGLRVTDSGVIWPSDDAATPPLSTVMAASDHRLIWVDLQF